MFDDVCDHDNIYFELSDDEADIIVVITYVKKFFLFAKLQTSSGTILETSTLNNQEPTKETDEADIDALIMDWKFFW